MENKQKMCKQCVLENNVEGICDRKDCIKQTIESPSVPMAHMPKDNIEEIRERLQHEIMEDYIRCAEHRYQVKDPVAHMEEMRGHFDKLVDFITQTHNNALRLVVESLPETICGVCGKKGVNVNGECRCSYELGVNISRDQAIKNIKELEV